MSNFDTITAITDNIETVLTGLGINFSSATYENDIDIPASLTPFGQIFYEGEEFEYVHGQKPKYAHSNFLLRVHLEDRSDRELTRSEQKWAHNIRDGLTVNALNVGDLVTTKYVNLVETIEVQAIHNQPRRGVLEYRVRVSYREQ